MPHANSVAIEAMPASYVNVPNCERIVASGTRIRVRSNTIGARLPLEPVRDIVGYFDRQGSVDQHTRCGNWDRDRRRQLLVSRRWTR
jgi:hypothetical protein